MSPEAERWRNIPVAVAVDVSGGACLVDPAIRPLRPPGQQPRLFGRAVTAICVPPDFGAVLRALDLITQGDVLVIAAQGNRHTAMLGEILGGQLRRLKAAGIVCDGAVRDVTELAGWSDLSVFARSITPKGPTGISLGTVNGSAVIGGLVISPGDLVMGDDDGVCALTPEMIHNLIDKAEAKLVLEARWQEILVSGKSIAETFGLATDGKPS